MSLPGTDFDREREWWNAKAPKEDTDAADERINRGFRWREIERHLRFLASLGMTRILSSAKRLSSATESESRQPTRTL